MNRLVIIGNGFDLAHGLKTSYNDFIDDFWKNILNDFVYPKLDINNEFIELNIDFGKMEYAVYSKDISNINDKAQQISSFEDFNRFRLEYEKYGNNIISFSFKNNFFNLICNKKSKNWVDIENEYYYQLKKIVREKIPKETVLADYRKTEETLATEKQTKIQRLNKEFEQIKQLFEKYLKEKVEPTIKEIIDEFPDLFVRYKSDTEFQQYLKEFPLSEYKELEDFNNSLKSFTPPYIYEKIIEGEIIYKVVFLNFNYTTMLSKYRFLNAPFVREIQIHGKIDDKNNKINFGFGDEMDEDYKVIENLNDNEYLKNFKSFGYSQNSNYKDLLDFIETEKFQVYIMGHSCGISDRTMLNTIFEHQNCRSIKIFYHKKKDDSDNYIEIVQNISRHFNKKKLMREKIVNKTLCSPLPQINNNNK
ncbi:MAG: AbiH family protein [Flavobacteriaceae bacterium]